MAKYTKNQAMRKAQMVVSQLGAKIKAACTGTGVDPAFLAGKIGVEAGVKDGKIKESATRYEHHHFIALKSIRDKGIHKGRKSFNGVTQKEIKDASDQALRALATSYGVSQIMGWWMLNGLAGTIADLRDPDKHLAYTMQLMMIMAAPYLRAKNYEAALRIWNTGKPNGNTYDPNYVHNALAVMECAKPLLKALPAQKALPEPQGTMDVELVVADAETQEPNEIDFDDDDDVINAAEEPAAPAENPAPASPASDKPASTTPTGTGSQTAENITNVINDASAAPADPNFVPEVKKINTPLRERLKEQLKSWWLWFGLAPPTGAGILQAVNDFKTGGIDFGAILNVMLQVFMFVFPYVVYLALGYVLYRTVKMVLIQVSFILKVKYTVDPKMHNPVFIDPHSQQEQEQPKGWIQKIF